MKICGKRLKKTVPLNDLPIWDFAGQCWEEDLRASQ